MKLKQTPADFRVEERTSVSPGPAGDFALYRLEKAGWTTPDALSAVRRRWQLDPRRVSYGGFKDKHAETSQHFTVFRGPKQGLQHHTVRVTYLGQVDEPFTAAHILANGFAVTLRSLTPDAERQVHGAVGQVAHTGVPNYFDDQRFSSVGPGHEFVAREMVHGRFEAALRLALVAPYEFDPAEAKREKALLADGWGDWPALKARLPKGHARSLVSYLSDHPTDFKGAVARLRPDLQGLYLAAYQSYLWNRVLGRWLTATFPPADLGRVDLRLGEFPVPLAVPPAVRAAWEGMTLPLPSARLKPDPAADWLPHVSAVLADDGLTLEKMKVPGLNKPFFSKGDRAACVRPAGLAVDPDQPDELNRGRRKLTLRFDLPRGSYATMLVKRVAQTDPGTR